MLTKAMQDSARFYRLEIWETLRLKSTKLYDQLAGKANVKGSNSKIILELMNVGHV